MCVCVCLCVCVCVRARARACVRACLRACIHVSINPHIGLPSATSIPDTLSTGMSLLGLAVAGTMTLKDKAAQVARELDIPIAENEAQREE